MTQYYAYVYSDPRTLIPFYVGKGKRGQRGWATGLNKDNHSGLMSLSLKMSEIAKKRTGTKNPNFGNHPKFSEETKQKMSKGHMGMKWITNGVIEYQIHYEEGLPNGFIFSRLKRK